jgi:hypothetical protein
MREIADARDRRREKSPTREIAAARSRQGWLGSNVHVTGGKGEKARRAVYGQGASSRRTHASVRVRRRGGNARSTTRMKPEPGDAHARWETIARSANRRDATASAGANAVSGGKASKGRRAPRGSSFRDEGKRGEPQDRQQGETDLHGRRGKTAEVVQNHEGGTRDGRQSIPEGIERSGNLVLPRTSRPGVGLPGSVRWRGGLWKPQERKFGWMAEPYGSGRDGRAGVKVKRVERTFVFQTFRALVVRASGIPAYTA